MQTYISQCSMTFLLKNVSTQKNKLGKVQPSGDPNVVILRGETTSA